MTDAKKLLLLPGDGIGQEVMAQLRRVIEWFEKQRSLQFEVEQDDIGGAAFDRYGLPLADETLDKAAAADAIVLGAVGGPKWNGVRRHERPEAGLLRLRKELDLFANLRPAFCRPALAAASSLKEELISGLDLMIVRELTGGVYFGEPRGVETMADGRRRGLDTQVYFDDQIERLMRVAFDTASKRDNKVTSVEKANVMESGVLWRQVATEVGQDYPDVELEHMYADNCAMQLVRLPMQFDVIATDNLFGDVLSDCGAMLTGSLGMLPSASLGPADQAGNRRALYEPVHGSAPDIAGQNKANPLATILSFGMCLKYSFEWGDEAALIDSAVDNLLAGGVRTADIVGMLDVAPVSTTQMIDALLDELTRLA